MAVLLLGLIVYIIDGKTGLQNRPTKQTLPHAIPQCHIDIISYYFYSRIVHCAFDTLLLINEYNIVKKSETTQPVEHMYEDFGSFVDYHAVYGDSLGITIGFLLLEYVLEVGRGPTLTNRPRCAMVSSSDNLEIVMHVLQQVQLFVISVMYFLLVMILCVLSLASTVLVMHTCSDRYPLRPMPDWVCCLLPTYITRTGWLKIVSHYQESST